MKRILTLVLGSFLFLGALFQISGCTNGNAQNRTNKTDDMAVNQRVKDIMSKMTLEDKVGEMTQLSIDVLSKGSPYNLDEPHQLVPEKLRKVLVDLRVGSILNVGGHAYTREHWKEIITAIQEVATKEKPSGIPVLYGIDAIHGTNYTQASTLFPQQFALAATWNPELARRMGEITAYETRASGIPWDFSPVLDIGRDPRWPRFWETFGEDVFLASKMGAEIIKGYQGDDVSDKTKVAACMKHFIGYSMPLSGKDRTPAWIPERQLQEYFVPTFQAAVDAGAKTVMICSGEMNGIPVHANPRILKDLLRGQLGFKGLAVTDWEDIGYLVERHHVAHNFKEAIKMAINAGIDMAMVPMDTRFPIILKELVEEGEVPMSRIDEAVARILTLKVELGLFENPYYPFEDYDKFGSEEHVEAAYQAALECQTLLKNEDNILPLSKDKKVLVTGLTSNSMLALNGGWTRTWQGNDPKYYEDKKPTILDAIRSKVGTDKVIYESESDLSKVKAAAAGADVAVVCIGEMPYTEKPGDIDDLYLPQIQYDLVKTIASTGTPVVLVLVEGRPRIVREAESLSKAVLMSYLPGNEGGRAIAEVLYGDYNPNGKLCFTYPRYPNACLNYDHKWTDRFSRDFSWDDFKPQWVFGEGLSYTNFEYSDLKLASKTMTDSEPLKISVVVTNTGKRAGKEVVQLYISDKVASITPPYRRLRGFEKIELEAGESKTVEFTIKPRDLAFVGLDNKWITEPGGFRVQIQDLHDDFVYEKELK
ncbi:MAG: beta-glucosidase [Bacteroidetes bacterium]|nr:MAG: beta-glucosidase [Bacteroidota bacterium]